MYTRINYHNRLRCIYQVYAGFWAIEYMCRFFYYLRESKLRSEKIKFWTFKTSYINWALVFRLVIHISNHRNTSPYENVSKNNFTFDWNVWISSYVWLRYLQRWLKRHTLLPMLISKVMHSLRYEIFKSLKGRVIL